MGIEQYLSFVSPAFFRVLPTRKLWSRAKDIRSRAKDADLAERLREDRAARLERSPLDVRLVSKVDGKLEPQQCAERVVKLYFQQLFDDGPTLIDLRAQAFGAEGDTLTWRPASWSVEWDETFLDALRKLYLGFYRDDDATFREGLAQLDMQDARDVLRSHFGTEPLIDFSTKAFTDSFHAVFVRCAEKNIELHPDFLPLGLYLATMYDHLDGLSVNVDVAACFFEAIGESPEPVRSAANG